MRSLLLLLAAALPLQAQTYKMEPATKSPADSLACIKTRPGFKVELMVAEPLVKSPIAFAWGPNGKFWVVEMGDYPLGLDGKGKPGGKIKYLEKTKPDGPYDKMTVFMDGLGFPTGVFPYAKGVLVTCAPDIFYAEVGPDGKAGKKEVLFTGFREGNQQHRVNGLVWGIDNWIYGANGDSGGIVKSIKTGKSVNISGRDFRLKPDTGEFEAVSGQSQFGRCRDDWGNWFGNNNSNPMYHYVLDDHYLRRNPHVLYPDPKVPVSVKPGASEVFPISKPLPRFNSPQALNHFTSACSTIIYRDTLFGKEFEGNMFVSEPVHNLIHREIMKPKGVTFTSQRADDEQTSEFLASSDNWFRPTMIQVGPDGALWIADMYRYVIEHPEWIPKDWQKKLDLRAGADKGRIYRVYPADKTPRAMVRMDVLTMRALVASLESPNGWVRDTAHQLIYERACRTFSWEPRPGKRGFGYVNQVAYEEARRLLEELMDTTTVPQAHLHALRCSSPHPGLWNTPESFEEKSMRHPHPAIRKHSIEITEFIGGAFNTKTFDALEKDENDQVRLQFAYSAIRVAPAGKGVNQAPRLVRLLFANAENRYIVAAGLSSVSATKWSDIFAEIMTQEKIPAPLFAPLVRLAKAYGEPLDAPRLFVRQIGLQDKAPTIQNLSHVADVLDIMAANGVSLPDLIKNVKGTEIAKSAERLVTIHDFALGIAKNPKEATRDRIAAVRVLDRGLTNNGDDQKLLKAMLTPQTPDELQVAAIQQLAGSDNAAVPALLLAPWKSFTPALRNQVLDTLFGRATWTKTTLKAIEAKQVPVQEIDAIRRQRLLQHKDAEIRTTAAKLFAAASNSDRGKVVDLYWLQMPAKADAMRGGKLFAKSCATCHKFGGVGENVGPDLASVGDKSPQGLLTAILDPNRAVESRYINYLATTKAGLSYNGILSSETSTSITLVSADGKSHQLLRNELDELSSTGKSLMPEGLEKDLTPQDIADIIEHVRIGPAVKNRE
jgi:putative membrane-bound dehydrogenase-like protein